MRVSPGRPDVQGGWLRTLLGDPEQATLRAGDAMTFGLEQMDRAGSTPSRGTGKSYTDINTTFDPGGRIGQLVWRINW